MKQYPREYQEHSSYGSCVRLLERAGIDGGVVLDLGCGRSPVAEVLRDAGYDYVGTDVDLAALDDVHGRGFEIHPLSLTESPDDLAAAIKGIVGDRRLAAVLALDVLEHLEQPGDALRAVASVAREHDGAQLVVSIPNVTHVDVGAKLLLGRWDLTGTGLLDDTHLRFFNERLLDDLLGGAGWQQVDADDVDLEYSDQRFPEDAPVIRPGVPARELLLRLRRAADHHATTYQFVRRCTVSAPRPAPIDIRDVSVRDRFMTVYVEAGADVDLVLADLHAQTVPDVEVVQLEASAHATLEHFTTARGRYACFLDGSVRLAPTWIEELQRAEAGAPSHLLVSGAAAIQGMANTERHGVPFAELVADSAPLHQLWLDVLHVEQPGALVVATHAVPSDALGTCGIGPDPALGPAAMPVMLLRAAELCGVHYTKAITVAVPAEGLAAGTVQLLLAAHVLDESPWVLPVGSFSRAAALRDHLVASRTTERLALDAAAARDGEVETLREHVRRLGAELDAANAQLEQAASGGRAKRALKHLPTMLRSRRREAKQ